MRRQVCHCFTSQFTFPKKGGVRQKLKAKLTVLTAFNTTLLSGTVKYWTNSVFISFSSFLLLAAFTTFYHQFLFFFFHPCQLSSSFCLPGRQSAVLMKLFNLTLEAHQRKGWTTVNAGSAKMNKKGQNKQAAPLEAELRHIHFRKHTVHLSADTQHLSFFSPCFHTVSLLAWIQECHPLVHHIN